MMQAMTFSEWSRNAFMVILMEKVLEENTGSAKGRSNSLGETVAWIKVLRWRCGWYERKGTNTNKKYVIADQWDGSVYKDTCSQA